jgi:GntR family transcriptional regulator, vanillate catabolism transcriptional regulator
LSTQLSEAIVRLREMILRGELVPGQRLAEAPIAEQLGMSRTPVRQALPMLAQEGLLIEHGTRGYVVRAFTPRDVLDAIDIRGVLEGIAARRVAELGVSKAFVRELRACLHAGDELLRKRRLEENDEAPYAEMNTRFHSLILREAGSVILSEALERNNRVPFAGPQALAFDRTNLERMYDVLFHAHRQHHAIVEALEHGESGRAEALMREHANSPKESLNLSGFHMAPADAMRRLAIAK